MEITWCLDFITRNDEAAEAAALQPEIYRALDRRREQEETNVEDIEARLKERYSKQYTASTFRGDIQNVPMQFLLPTGQDPNLWLVKCKVCNFDCKKQQAFGIDAS